MWPAATVLDSAICTQAKTLLYDQAGWGRSEVKWCLLFVSLRLSTAPLKCYVILYWTGTWGFPCLLQGPSPVGTWTPSYFDARVTSIHLVFLGHCLQCLSHPYVHAVAPASPEKAMLAHIPSLSSTCSFCEQQLWSCTSIPRRGQEHLTPY